MKPAHKRSILKKVDKLFIRRLVDLLPPLSTSQSRFTSRDVLRSVVGAVQDHDFIEGWTDHQREMGHQVPSGDLVHLRLGALTTEDVMGAFRILNGELLDHMDRVRPWRKPVHLAIDFHSMAYYGQYRGGQVVGAKGLRGTNWGYQFASIQGVCGRRCTFHAVPVVQFANKADIIRELMEEARRHVEVSMVYLDRGFYSAACLRELEGIGVRYLMPVPQNKTVKSLMAELMPYSRVVGTRGWSYSKVMRWVGGKDKVEVQMVFLFRPDPDDEDFVFITNVEVDDKNVEALAEDTTSIVVTSKNSAGNLRTIEETVTQMQVETTSEEEEGLGTWFFITALVVFVVVAMVAFMLVRSRREEYIEIQTAEETQLADLEATEHEIDLGSDLDEELDASVEPAAAISRPRPRPSTQKRPRPKPVKPEEPEMMEKDLSDQGAESDIGADEIEQEGN